ncbi:MAG TPA: hypothetical protein PLK80_10675, partial [bacterium]|nr:hypothetical protein [bacterium]
KLNLSTHVGGQLLNYISEPALIELIDEVDGTYLRFGASSTIYGDETDAVSEIRRKSALAGLSLAVSRIRHIGTEVCFDVLSAIRGELLDAIDFKPDTMVARILVEDGRATGVETADGALIRAKYVIVAPGREGAEWLASESASACPARTTPSISACASRPVPQSCSLSQMSYTNPNSSTTRKNSTT